MDEDFPFDYFEPEAIEFFNDLAANNNRDWFHANKDRYEAYVKVPGERFCQEMLPILSSMTGVPHQSKIFRINRDVRFSQDKRPYKAHMHMLFRPQEDRINRPAWFFGIAPKGVFFGCGIMWMEKAALDSYRNRVAGPAGADLQKIMKRFDKNGFRMREPQLKRVPNQFPKDHPHGALLRRKSLAAWIDYDSPQAALEMSFIKTCKSEYKRLKPLFDWCMDS